MAMQTGENEQALRKILDMTRLISIAILVLHFYYYCYTAFDAVAAYSHLNRPAFGATFITPVCLTTFIRQS